MKTHIVEQDRDGMIIPVKTVWIVLQTQAECDYREYPIAVFTDEDDAYELSRALNKRYGRGCRFTTNWDYDQDNTDEYDDTHYYTVGRYELNPKMEDYL